MLQKFRNVCIFRMLFQICDTLCYSEVTKLESAKIGEKSRQNLQIFAPQHVGIHTGPPVICIIELHHIPTSWQWSHGAAFFGLED